MNPHQGAAGSPSLAGWSRSQLTDHAVEVLRESILRGDFAPGDRLRQEELAADLGLSRTPVREALRVLHREGLVVLERSGGMRVVERNPATLVGAYELREVVDGLAARLAARDLSSDLVTGLEQVLDEQSRILEAEWSSDDWARANTRFHGLIMEATRNPYLLTLVPFVQMTSQVFQPVGTLGRDRAVQAYDEHRAIAKAIQAKKPEKAESLARDHVARTARTLKAQMGGVDEH